MARLTRKLFLQRAQHLLLKQGGLDVSLSSVLKACDANKGSLYHFFPAGKDELLFAAMECQAEYALSSNKKIVESSSCTSEAVKRLTKSLAAMIESDQCPDILPFAVAGTVSDAGRKESQELCAKTLESLQRIYADNLRKDGIASGRARSLASVIVSTIEGALLQSRTRNSSLPLKNAAIHLCSLIDSHTKQ